jgi:hypothetical protein
VTGIRSASASADLDPFGHPAVMLTRQPPYKRHHRSRPVHPKGAGPVGPFDQPAARQLTLLYCGQDIGEHLGGQYPRRIRTDSGREFGGERMKLRRLHPELRFDHVFDTNTEHLGQGVSTAPTMNCTWTTLKSDQRVGRLRGGRGKRR